MNAIEVLSPGPMTTVQDRGRRGWAHLGVPPSGAADARALDLGNRLVGNEPGAAALEATLAGPRLRFRSAVVAALTGAEARAVVAGRPIEPNRPIHVAAGEVLEVGGYSNGARLYVSVRGGIAVDRVLGSRATDLLTGLGPAPLQEGDVLPIGEEVATRRQADVREGPELSREPVLRLRLGPQAHWFGPDAPEVLAVGPWTVSAASNRVGLRLEGSTIERVCREELLSQGVVTGALQVPPSGQPILLMNDHPTTGGYPVIGVVDAADVPLVGQLRPAQHVRFEVNQGSQP